MHESSMNCGKGSARISVPNEGMQSAASCRLREFHLPTAGTSWPLCQSLVSTPNSSKSIFFVRENNFSMEPQFLMQSSACRSAKTIASCSSIERVGPIASKLCSKIVSKSLYQFSRPTSESVIWKGDWFLRRMLTSTIFSSQFTTRHKSLSPRVKPSWNNGSIFIPVRFTFGGKLKSRAARSNPALAGSAAIYWVENSSP